MEYRVTDANDIDMLMDVRLSMLRIVNDLPAYRGCACTWRHGDKP